MIFYTQTTSIIVNVVVALIALLGIGISVYFMCLRSGCSWKGVLLRFSLTIGLQFVSLALGLGLSLLVAVFMDGVNRSMSWFTNSWTIFGLYLAPILFGLSILPALYLEKTKRDPLGLGFRIQLFMHSHCICLILIMLILTGLSIRSAYLIMLCVVFDIVALTVNLVTKWHRKGECFWILNLRDDLLIKILSGSLFVRHCCDGVPDPALRLLHISVHHGSGYFNSDAGTFGKLDESGYGHCSHYLGVLSDVCRLHCE